MVSVPMAGSVFRVIAPVIMAARTNHLHSGRDLMPPDRADVRAQSGISAPFHAGAELPRDHGPFRDPDLDQDRAPFMRPRSWAPVTGRLHGATPSEAGRGIAWIRPPFHPPAISARAHRGARQPMGLRILCL